VHLIQAVEGLAGQFKDPLRRDGVADLEDDVGRQFNPSRLRPHVAAGERSDELRESGDRSDRDGADVTPPPLIRLVRIVASFFLSNFRLVAFTLPGRRSHVQPPSDANLSQRQRFPAQRLGRLQREAAAASSTSSDDFDESLPLFVRQILTGRTFFHSWSASFPISVSIPLVGIG
jgi:hypothetical protein